MCISIFTCLEANSEEEVLELAIAKVEGESLDEFGECCDTKACITYEDEI